MGIWTIIYRTKVQLIKEGQSETKKRDMNRSNRHFNGQIDIVIDKQTL